MKRFLLVILILMTFALCACSIEGTARTYVIEPSKEVEQEPEIALAMCMPYIDAPELRPVQLGFIEQCEAQGIEDFVIIGARNDEQLNVFKAALDWAKNMEGKRTGMILWNGDHNSDELCLELKEMGVYVGIPHFQIFKEDDPKLGIVDGVNFEYSVRYEDIAVCAANLLAEHADGKKGTIMIGLTGNISIIEDMIGENLNEIKDMREWEMYDLGNVNIVQANCGLFEEKDDDEARFKAACEVIKQFPDVIGTYNMFENDIELGTRALKAMGREDVFSIYWQNSGDSYKQCEKADGVMLFANRLYDEGTMGVKKLTTLIDGGEVPVFEYLDFYRMDNDKNADTLNEYAALMERVGVKSDEFYEGYFGEFVY